jgi:tetratricopeptide (TPR) repeat protein
MIRVSETNLLLAVLAAGLLGLGVPRTIDTVLQLRAGGAEDLSNASNFDDLAMQSVDAARLERIDGRFHDPAASIRAGTIQFVLAAGAGDDADHAQIDTAIANLESGLARAPADPKGWMMLALARAQRGNSDGARLALRSSIAIAPQDPTLALARAELGLKLLSVLPPEEWELVSEQIRIAAASQFDGLVKYVQDGGDLTPITTALAGEPDRVAALIAALNPPAANN